MFVLQDVKPWEAILLVARNVFKHIVPTHRKLVSPANSRRAVVGHIFSLQFSVWLLNKKPGTNPRTKHGERHPSDVKMLSSYLAGLAAVVRQVASALAFMHKSPWAQDLFFKQESSDAMMENFWLDVCYNHHVESQLKGVLLFNVV